jgi:hypothetical protein
MRWLLIFNLEIIINYTIRIIYNLYYVCIFIEICLRLLHIIMKNVVLIGTIQLIIDLNFEVKYFFCKPTFFFFVI